MITHIQQFAYNYYKKVWLLGNGQLKVLEHKHYVFQLLLSNCHQSITW